MSCRNDRQDLNFENPSPRALSSAYRRESGHQNGFQQSSPASNAYSLQGNTFYTNRDLKNNLTTSASETCAELEGDKDLQNEKNGRNEESYLEVDKEVKARAMAGGDKPVRRVAPTVPTKPGSSNRPVPIPDPSAIRSSAPTSGPHVKEAKSSSAAVHSAQAKRTIPAIQATSSLASETQAKQESHATAQVKRAPSRPAPDAPGPTTARGKTQASQKSVTQTTPTNPATLPTKQLPDTPPTKLLSVPIKPKPATKPSSVAHSKQLLETPPTKPPMKLLPVHIKPKPAVKPTPVAPPSKLLTETPPTKPSSLTPPTKPRPTTKPSLVVHPSKQLPETSPTMEISLKNLLETQLMKSSHTTPQDIRAAKPAVNDTSDIGENTAKPTVSEAPEINVKPATKPKPAPQVRARGPTVPPAGKEGHLTQSPNPSSEDVQARSHSQTAHKPVNPSPLVNKATRAGDKGRAKRKDKPILQEATGNKVHIDNPVYDDRKVKELGQMDNPVYDNREVKVLRQMENPVYDGRETMIRQARVKAKEKKKYPLDGYHDDGRIYDSPNVKPDPKVSHEYDTVGDQTEGHEYETLGTAPPPPPITKDGTDNTVVHEYDTADNPVTRKKKATEKDAHEYDRADFNSSRLKDRSAVLEESHEYDMPATPHQGMPPKRQDDSTKDSPACYLQPVSTSQNPSKNPTRVASSAGTRIGKKPVGIQMKRPTAVKMMTSKTMTSKAESFPESQHYAVSTNTDIIMRATCEEPSSQEQHNEAKGASQKPPNHVYATLEPPEGTQQGGGDMRATQSSVQNSARAEEMHSSNHEYAVLEAPVLTDTQSNPHHLPESKKPLLDIVQHYEFSENYLNKIKGGENSAI